MKIPGRTPLAALLALGLAAWAHGAATLKVGDRAPGLQYAEWLKGAPVKAFQPGRVYVVEFWATWCGWCKASMNHLSAMAREYAGKATFISMNVESMEGGQSAFPRVERFVTYAGDMMSYDVAADTGDRWMETAWLKAAGQGGIPCSFIVDQDGRVAWIGHPAIGLEEALRLVIDRRLTPAAAEKIKADGEAMTARVQGLLVEMSRLLARPAEADTVIRDADEVMGLNSLWNAQAIPVKYRALQARDPAAGRAYGEAVIADKSVSPMALAALVGIMMNPRAFPHPDLKLANDIMNTLLKTTDPEDSNLWMPHARLCYLNGDAAQAVSLQKKLIADLEGGLRANHLPDAAVRQRLAPYEQTLKEYQGGT